MAEGFAGLLGGLADGWDRVWTPTPPPGAAYDADTMSMAQAALLAKIGSSLMGAGQGGQSFDARARALQGLGDAPGAYADVISSGVRNAYTKKMTEAQQMEMDLKRKEMERQQAEDEFYRKGLSSTVAVTNPTVRPLPASTTGPLANQPVMTGSTAAPVSSTLQKGPVQQPSTGSGSPGAGTWWGDLGLTQTEAAAIARLPSETRRSVVAELVKKRAERREKYDVVGDGKTGWTRVYADGRRERLQDGVGSGIPGGVGEDTMKQEQQLRSEFHDRTKDFAGRQTAYKTVQDLAAKGQGASDIALVISVMKVFDPGSTVTGNEVANMANAGGVPSQIQGIYNQIVGGGKLSDEMRQQLVEAAGSRYDQEYDAYGKQAQTYGDLSKQYGVEPSRVVKDERDPEYNVMRQVKRLSPQQIAQATPADLEVISRHSRALSTQQLLALRQRLAQFRTDDRR